MSTFGHSASDLKSKCFFLSCSKVQQSHEDKSIKGEAGYIPQLALLFNFHPLSITACPLQGWGGGAGNKHFVKARVYTLDSLPVHHRWLIQTHIHTCRQFSHKLTCTCEEAGRNPWNPHRHRKAEVWHWCKQHVVFVKSRFPTPCIKIKVKS